MGTAVWSSNLKLADRRGLLILPAPVVKSQWSYEYQSEIKIEKIIVRKNDRITYIEYFNLSYKFASQKNMQKLIKKALKKARDGSMIDLALGIAIIIIFILQFQTGGIEDF